MADNRDWRVRIDLNFPPEDEGVARGVFNHAKNQMDKAVPIFGPDITYEATYIELERDGHRTHEPCEILEKEEVP